MMKQISINLLAVVIGVFFFKTTLAQNCECLIKGGQFKDFSLQTFSHHDPDQSAIIISLQSDSVRSILAAKVHRIN
jgi:hypothetical protein